MSVGAVNKNTGERIPTAGMPAIDNALSATSTNPVQNAIITAALADKQDKTDNALQTTDKTVVGAINEHEGDIDSLKSGLINYENQNDLNLEVPYRKNVLENTANSATVYGVLYTVNNDGSVSVSTETQSSNISSLQINDFTLPAGEYVLNGCPSGGGSNKYELQIAIGGATYRDYGGGVSFTSTNQRCVVQILIRSGVTINDTFYPMIRPATITDPTFAPYIPSVESRIEAVESGLIDVNSNLSSYEATTNAALALPENTGKNVLPMTLESIKSLNTTGTWNDNAYTINTLVFAVNTDANGRITSIVANGTPSTDSSFVLTKVATLSSSLNGSYILTGCPSGGGSNYNIHIGSSAQDDGSGASFTTPLSGSNCAIRVKGSYAASNLAFYPMIRRADIADATYVPYIPSVESRIEAVESGVAGLTTTFKVEGSATDLSLWANDNGVVVLSTYIAAIDKRVGFKRAADGTISSYESD